MRTRGIVQKKNKKKRGKGEQGKGVEQAQKVEGKRRRDEMRNNERPKRNVQINKFAAFVLHGCRRGGCAMAETKEGRKIGGSSSGSIGFASLCFASLSFALLPALQVSSFPLTLKN